MTVGGAKFEFANSIEFTLQEIAQTLRIPLGTVKSRLSVGIHRLRDVLAPIQEGVE